jgi:hypothetical protein
MWRKGNATIVTGASERLGPACALARRLSPLGIRATGGRAWCAFAVAVVAMCGLASCLAPSASVMHRPDLSRLEMDPSRFRVIALRDDLEIKTAVIHAEKGAKPRTLWHVLEYVEHENRRGFVPDRESEYTNLFLVNEVERTDEQGAIVRRRYLVVDLWRYYPAQGIKTCHQWTIREDDLPSARTHASFQFLVEDFDNVFLEERVVSLDPLALERLGDFYQKVKAFLSQRVKGLPVDTAHHIE